MRLAHPTYHCANSFAQSGAVPGPGCLVRTFSTNSHQRKMPTLSSLTRDYSILNPNLPPPDLMPDSALAKILVGGFSALLYVKEDILLAAVALFALNTLVSIWYTFIEPERLMVDLAEGTFKRLGAYIIALMMIVVWSRMVGDIEVIRRFAFSAVGGIELAVALGTLARIVPGFETYYLWVLRWIRQYTPIEPSDEDIQRLIEKKEEQ
ncbi:hypothetical protein [Salisaeta icosahedral phage 1]|uniref:hypothetical protein n=1 Tax=Salisaeta icosahedral phage 1 TaxID=1183239 RepID=UPI00025EA93E|nr:hypothetical protein A322_gp49 [Salisaeta icosahedral phage 1]AFJ21504.1 hypothetical protein [Salisaeta icosahedral phage 1]